MIILSLAIALGALGLALGLALAFSSKFFAVNEDPKIKEIESKLPGANCGACGYPGCYGYASAIANDGADVNLCKPGGKKSADSIGKIVGKAAGITEPMVAVRYCNGGIAQAKIKYDYEGIKSCRAASLINNGYKQCAYSCLGFGDCVDVCPVNAIRIDDNGLPCINYELCIGCSKCVAECPRAVLKLAPKKSKVHVHCSNHDGAKIVVKSCTAGCISCKKCESACKFDAIHVIGHGAVIDYSKCKSCGLCVGVCPKKVIGKR